jgi:hypothetical protein
MVPQLKPGPGAGLLLLKRQGAAVPPSASSLSAQGWSAPPPVFVGSSPLATRQRLPPGLLPPVRPGVSRRCARSPLRISAYGQMRKHNT